MAIDLEEVLFGHFEMEFVGDSTPRNVEVRNFVVNGPGDILYLTGPDGTIYNWSTIIRLKRIKP